MQPHLCDFGCDVAKKDQHTKFRQSDESSYNFTLLCCTDTFLPVHLGRNFCLSVTKRLNLYNLHRNQ